jgi:uncharacterized delta-60 repeat protein
MKTYGGSGNDQVWSVQQTGDGGCILAGWTASFGAGGNDFWVLRLDSTGSVVWQKAYGGALQDDARCVKQTSDGGYVVAGETNSFGTGGLDFWVLRLNSNGSIVWQKTYGGTGDDTAWSVEQTADGGYIVGGQTASFGAGSIDAWVLKLDSNGSVTWQKTYGGSGADVLRSVGQSSDGGYIVAGYTISFGAGTLDAWILKLSSNGSVTWQKTYGGYSDDYVTSIQETQDGGYIAAGTTLSFGAGSYNIWVLKLDSNGSAVWQKTYGGAGGDYADSVQQTSDGGYIVAGHTSSFGAGSWDAWVLKLDSAGSLTWQKTYGGSDNDQVYSVRQTTDGGYILAGFATSFGAGGSDVWAIKLDSSGSVPLDGGSGASTQTTSAVPLSSSAAISLTSVTPADSAATVKDSLATPQDTDATVNVQSSPDTTPPATILDLATSNPTANSITLTWTAPGDNGMSGNAAGYVVKYSTSGPITAANWGSATNYTQTWTPAKGGTRETQIASGLNNDTRYWFAVEAYDEVPYYGGVSDSPSDATLEGFPPATITDLAAINPTTGSVTLTWTAPGDNGTIGTAAGYIVKYFTSGPITGTNWGSAATYLQSWMPLPAGSSEGHTILGLRNATRYWFAIKGYDEASNYGGVSNSPSRVTADAFPPAAVTDLATSNPAANSITLTWTAPGDNGKLGTATGYIMKYSTTGPITASNWNSATTYTQTWAPLPAGNTESHVVVALKNATRYWFAVEAYDGASPPNYSGVSNSPSGTTAGGTGSVEAPLIVVPVMASVVALVFLVALVYARQRRTPTGVPRDGSTSSEEGSTEVEVATFSVPRSVRGRIRKVPAVAIDLCPHCGAKMRVPDAEFCWNCGASLERNSEGVLIGYGGREAATAGRCMVCNSDVMKTDVVARCPYCRNVAHKVHLLEWLHVKDYCPICGEHLVESDLRE